MEFKEAYKKLLKKGKTITDGYCRITIENTNFLIVERIYRLEKLNLPALKRFIPRYVYDSDWEWEEDHGGGTTWEAVDNE